MAAQTRRRSIAKTVGYRLIATSLVVAIAFATTGSLNAAATIGLSAAVAKTTLYYLWERLWSGISWGVVGA